jgi:hypothetical protein
MTSGEEEMLFCGHQYGMQMIQEFSCGECLLSILGWKQRQTQTAKVRKFICREEKEKDA